MYHAQANTCTCIETQVVAKWVCLAHDAIKVYMYDVICKCRMYCT